jgi:hypothetical protein
MTEQDRELWPGRCRVFAKVDIVFPGDSEDDIYKDTWMELFQPDIPEDELTALLEPLGFYPDMDGYDYIVSQAEDTFSEEQADELIAHLETHPGTKTWKRPAYKPENRYLGVSYRADGHVCYDFSMEASYSLDFKAIARYFTDTAAYRKFGDEKMVDFLDGITVRAISQEEADADDMYQEKRQKIDESLSLMDEDELDELQEWIDGRYERDMKQALINSINQLLTGMTVEQLEMIETYIAKIE